MSKRNLHQELKDYNYSLYIETIEKSEALCSSIENELANGKDFKNLGHKIENFLVERTLQLKNKY